jgi:hypothetical protein
MSTTRLCVRAMDVRNNDRLVSHRNVPIDHSEHDNRAGGSVLLVPRGWWNTGYWYTPNQPVTIDRPYPHTFD